MTNDDACDAWAEEIPYSIVRMYAYICVNIFNEKSHTNCFGWTKKFIAYFLAKMIKYCPRKFKVLSVKFRHSKLQFHNISVPFQSSSRRGEKKIINNGNNRFHHI